MITDDEVMRLFERADPARGRDSEPRLEAAAYLDGLRSTDRQVVLIDTADDTSAGTTGPRRRPLIIAAAAAVALFAAAAVVSRQEPSQPATNVTPAPASTTEPTQETDPTAAADTSAVEIAKGFLGAIAAFDTHRATTFLADDADLGPIVSSAGDELEGTPDEFRLWLSLMKAEGYEQSITNCEQRTPGTLTVVRCGFDFHTMGSDELGLGPFRGSYFDVTVRDGEVARAVLHWGGLDEFSPQLWIPFGDWMAATHPDAAAVMLDPTRSFERLTFESVALWDRYIEEYVRQVRLDSEGVANGFMLAYGAFDADAAIVYLADGADLVGIVNSGDNRGVYGSRSEFRLWVSLLEAEHYRQTLRSCEAQAKSASPGIRVRCTFDFHVLGSDEIGLGPFDGSYVDLNVRRGEIVRAVAAWDNSEFSPQVWIPFTEWVTSSYPEDVEIMYDASHSWEQLTVESIHLWQEHTADYVQHVLSSPVP